MYQLYQYFNLPRPVLIVIAILTATSVTGIFAAIDLKLALIVLAGFLLLAIAIGLFFFIRSWSRKRHAATLAGELQQHSGAAPTGINDAGQRARLDELRRTFSEGIAKFGSAENIHKFPWYLIVGEPGSGKTEAIRHCNVGFPPGLQNELQGVGGTINMNWWFTNQAVFLDTAGRLMFEEVRAGETNEWREFLALLKRNRSTCPINGLLLIIPADSLIKDSEEQINQKAGKIAQQFDVIQRTLDIRFPVFILITKCDLLSGFREFFDDFSDAQSQHQMIGWSNQDERDAPFRPDMVIEYIGTVVKRIEKRRFSLLRDPIPQKNLERRTDEVDALYGLPQSVALIAPKLRSYLEKVFLAGPWSPKPLFLRGIYFTSSMREGSALDQELAQALGLGIEDLRESKQWERERAYFLRDLFTEKVFRERGLVTRATNTRKMLRTRSVLLWGTGTALALLLIGSSFYFARQLENSVNEQAKFWAAGKIWERPGTWNPILVPETPGATRADYKGEDTVLTTGSGNISRVAFHQTLKDLASQQLNTGWVFKPMLKWVRVDGDRQLAQRIILEGGVLSPVVKTARQRMLLEDLADAPDKSLSTGARLKREADAIAALIRIETDAISKDVNLEAIPKGVAEPLVAYSTARTEPLSAKDSSLLGSVLVQTYSGSFRDRSGNAWPPAWMPLGSTNLSANKPIDAGIKRLQALASDSAKAQVEGLEEIKKLRDQLREFRQKESEMNATVTDPAAGRDSKVEGLFAQLQTIKGSIDGWLKNAESKGLISGNSAVLKIVYDRLVGDSQAGANSSFKVVKEAVRPQVANEKERLFAEVDQILDNTLNGLRDQIAKGFTEAELKELEQLDSYLADFGNGRRIYEVRWDNYADAYRQATTEDKLGGLIGTGWAKFGEIQTAITDRRRQVEANKQKLPEPFSAACVYFLDRAERIRLDRIGRAYIDQTNGSFDGNFFSPWVSGSRKEMTAGNRQEASRLMGKWKTDFKAEAFQKVNPAIRAKLERFGGELDKMPGIDAVIANYSVSVKYNPSGNREFFFKYRKARFGGVVYETDVRSFGGSYKHGGNFSMACIDFFSGNQREVTVSRDISALTRDSSISVEGTPLNLDVSVQGTPPNYEAQPKKSEVLAILK